MKKTKRKPAAIDCPFCDFKAVGWFLRDRLDELGYHLEVVHRDVNICPLCHHRRMDWKNHLNRGCIKGFGKDYRFYTYRHILAAFHAQLLGIEPKETAK
jgi:hypothetical protein